MFKILSPGNLFVFLNRVSKLIKVIFIPLLLVSLIFALLTSPEDYIQGDSVRIMYVHVPSSWIALACFSFMGFFTIIKNRAKIK